jgi:hypothetical protein
MEKEPLLKGRIGFIQRCDKTCGYEPDHRHCVLRASGERLGRTVLVGLALANVHH